MAIVALFVLLTVQFKNVHITKLDHPHGQSTIVECHQCDVCYLLLPESTSWPSLGQSGLVDWHN